MIDELKSLVNRLSERTWLEIDFIAGFDAHDWNKRLSTLWKRMPDTENTPFHTWHHLIHRYLYRLIWVTILDRSVLGHEMTEGPGFVYDLFGRPGVDLDPEELQVLEKVIGVLGRLKCDFEGALTVGLDHCLIGVHIENHLFLIYIVHVFILQSPEYLH